MPRDGDVATVPDAEVADELGCELNVEGDGEFEATLGVGDELVETVLDGEEIPLVTLIVEDETLIAVVVDEQDTTAVNEHGIELAIGVTDTPQGADATSTAAQYPVALHPPFVAPV